jgi:hypothetical protein
VEFFLKTYSILIVGVNLRRCEGVSFVWRRNVMFVDAIVLYSSNLQQCSNLAGVIGWMLCRTAPVQQAA